MLSVVIPFLNESTHLQRTLANLRETAGDTINIVVINDCSDDFFNYEALARHYSCTYLRNEQRKGVASCRDLGVAIADTANILLLDAHMKFFEAGWVEQLDHLIAQNSKAIYCTKSVVMDEKWQIDEQTAIGSGVKFKANQQEFDQFLAIEWLFEQKHLIEPTITEIPCVMGAAYSFSREFYLSIGGLAGLKTWGYDEQFLSLKTQMAGGHCFVINNLKTGHVYRSKFPYHMPAYAASYNKLVIGYLTGAFSADFMLATAKKENKFDESTLLFEQNLPLLEAIKQKLTAQVFHRPLWHILKEQKVLEQRLLPPPEWDTQQASVQF